MLNEKNEIEAILNGDRINKKHTYRSCYLLAKHYKSLDYEAIKIREEIFNWANKFKIFITDDLNSIILRAITDKKEIVDSVEIKISKEDMGEINKRFDKFNTKLTAFALLCFAKKYADKNGIFYMSLIGLSNWVNLQQQHLSTKYIKELITFSYIEKLTVNEIKYIKRRNKSISKALIYKISVNFKNEGDMIFTDTDIRSEFKNFTS